MGIKFDKDPLPVEQNNYFTKIVNVYIVYDLDAWPKIPLRIFTIKNRFFCATSIVQNSDKEKYVYIGYGIAFDRKGEQSFDNDTARNIVICGVDNSSSSQADNLKNNFLVKQVLLVLMEALVHQKKKFSISFSKANTRFCLSLHYNADNSYLFGNGKEIFKFKADNKNVNFQTQFCLGSISNGFNGTESKEESLRSISIDEFDILNIHNYLITKNNTK